jgi:DNA-binding transcriptional LysR family regulator
MPKPPAASPPPDLLHGKALPPFASLRAFEAVGRVGGVRKAATILSLDHTVVSRHIRFLEEWLGVPLFQRSAGRLIFTETGAAYHKRISAALIELASATSQVLHNDDNQYLRLWCVPGFAAQWLSDQLAEFERLWPESGIELRPTDEAADLIMHQADIDIRFYGDDWLPKPGGKGMRFVEIARPPIMAVANPEVAARLSTLRHISELVDGPLLHEEHHEQWRAWFALNDVTLTRKLQGPLLWHAHLAIAAARQGRGVALASTYLVGHDLANGTLVELVLPGSRQVVIGGYAFVTREDRWTSPPIVKLRRFLQANVK